MKLKISDIDAHPIMPKLWVGSAPPPGEYAGIFDVVVLVSDCYQPPIESFPGVIVRQIPFDDADPPSPRDLRAAGGASKLVAEDLAKGRRVLVTCRMGRNRSAFVAALALVRLGMRGAEAYRRVRERRVDKHGIHALENPGFVRTLHRLDAGRLGGGRIPAR